MLPAQALVRVAAVVSAPQTYEAGRDTSRATRRADYPTIRLSDGVRLNVRSGAGSVVRALPSDTSRTVRIVIDYVGS